ncbi:unnamed protein product [Trichobilharzia regenti]|nr:unnamed protein product [Trichobilharzia regenti]
MMIPLVKEIYPLKNGKLVFFMKSKNSKYTKLIYVMLKINLIYIYIYI